MSQTSRCPYCATLSPKQLCAIHAIELQNQLTCMEESYATEVERHSVTRAKLDCAHKALEDMAKWCTRTHSPGLICDEPGCIPHVTLSMLDAAIDSKWLATVAREKAKQVPDTDLLEKRYQKVIQDWKFHWMNREEGYFQRALAVDANMMHHLCHLLVQSEKDEAKPGSIHCGPCNKKFDSRKAHDETDCPVKWHSGEDQADGKG